MIMKIMEANIKYNRPGNKISKVLYLFSCPLYPNVTITNSLFITLTLHWEAGENPVPCIVLAIWPPSPWFKPALDMASTAQ